MGVFGEGCGPLGVGPITNLGTSGCWSRVQCLQVDNSPCASSFLQNGTLRNFETASRRNQRQSSILGEKSASSLKFFSTRNGLTSILSTSPASSNLLQGIGRQNAWEASRSPRS